MAKASRPVAPAASPAASVPQVEAPAVKGAESSKHSATVTVACKIPQGLRLQLQHEMERPMPTGRGLENDFQMTKVNVFGGDVWNVAGPAIPAMGGVPDGYVMPKIEAGFALTEVPRAFWETWLHQNRQADYVKSGMIFAYGDASNVKADAREHEKKLSGLEPISREIDDKGRMTDRRVPKPLTSSLGRVSPDAEREAARLGNA